MNKFDLYIVAMRYGSENLIGGVTFKGLRDHLKNEGFELKEDDNDFYRRFFNDIFDVPTGVHSQDWNDDKSATGTN